MSTTSTPTPPAVPKLLAYLDAALAAFDQFAAWWQTARWSARAAAAGVLAVAGGVVLLATWGLLELLGWIGGGLVDVLGSGAHATAAWRVTRVISDPLRHYLATAGAGLPADTGTLTVLWAAVCGLLWIVSLAGVRGARIGWAAIGAATTAMVYAGAPAAGHLVAAAVTVAAWSLLSIPAYWRHGDRRSGRERVLVLDPNPSRGERD